MIFLKILSVNTLQIQKFFLYLQYQIKQLRTPTDGLNGFNMTKILQLKNRLLSVEQNHDGTLLIIDEDFKPCYNAGSIIGSLGGVEATLLRCIDTDDSFADIVSKKKSQELIARNISKIVGERGLRCDVGADKFAILDGVYYRYQSPRGWQRSTEESYLKSVNKKAESDAYAKEQDDIYSSLVSDGVIAVTIDNLRIVMQYLQRHNWGSWSLPKMSIGYSANQYDCDGKIAVTIKLDKPIDYYGDMVSDFEYGAPHGHLTKYRKIR